MHIFSIRYYYLCGFSLFGALNRNGHTQNQKKKKKQQVKTMKHIRVSYKS